MDFSKLFGDIFNPPQNPLNDKANPNTFGGRTSALGGPISQGFNRVFNDPF